MSPLQIIEHTIPGQHIREHAQSIKGKHSGPLRIAIKQYVPVDQVNPVPDNAVTIIGSPGNGSPKEVYEPLWEDLYKELKKKGIPLRGIWMADFSNQAGSALMNEGILGDRSSMFDHSRDLLHMVNHFRDEIQQPIVGVGHSIGCTQIVHLSILHPRLLSTLIMFDPTILEPNGKRNSPMHPGLRASRRRDLWPSMEEAKSSLSKSLRTWDPRVQVRYFKYGLRNTPTALYPSTDSNFKPGSVTLATTKHQEAWNYVTPNLGPKSADRLLLPDWDTEHERPFIYARPECWAAMRNLPYLRPSVFWIFGDESYLSPPEAQDKKMRVTGTGTGGSGGAQAGMVAKAVLKGGSHVLCFEEIQWCAETAAGWLQTWFQQWLADEKFWSEHQSPNSDEQGLRLSEEAQISMGLPSIMTRDDRLKGKL